MSKAARNARRAATRNRRRPAATTAGVVASAAKDAAIVSAVSRGYETLESRTLFSTVHWEGWLGGIWSDPAAWLENQVPTTGDDVVLDDGTWAHNVGVDVANADINSLTMTGPNMNLLGNDVTIRSGGITSNPVSGSSQIDNNLFFAGGSSISAPAGTLFLNGDVTGDSGLTLSGNGTVEMYGTVNPGGTVATGATRLVVVGGINDVVQVNSGGRLAGTGYVDDVDAHAGSNISPGRGAPGTLSVGSVSMSSTTTTSIELNGTTPGSGYDRINVSGTATLDGTLDVSLGFTPSAGDTFVIVNNSSHVPTGTFAGLDEGDTFTVAGTEFRISYAGGSGNNDVTLTAVEDTSTDLQALDNTTVYSEDAFFAATVTSSGTTPTGNVRFYYGATLFDTVALDGSGVATTSIDTLAIGSHTIKAVYVGDGSHDASTSSDLTQTISKANSQISIDGTPNSGPFSNNVTFTASVAPAGTATATPAGNVTFYKGATSLGTVAISGYQASITLSTLPIGNHTITATYAGNGNFNGSTTSVGKTVTVTNNSPTGVAPVDVDVNEDAPDSVLDLTAAFEDVEDGDNLTYSILSNTNEDLFDSATINGSDLTFDYAADANGLADVTVRATDSDGAHADVVYNVNVGAVADPGRFKFTSATYSGDEGSTAQLTVLRVGGADGAAAVEYAVTGGTADDGGDFALASGTLTFADGETSKTISLPLDDDDLEEGAETITLELSDPTNGTGLDSITTTTVTITDVYNHGPDVQDLEVTHAPGAAVAVNPLGTAVDTDGDALTLSVVVPPSHGMATINDNGTPGNPSDDAILYTPTVGTYGEDEFTYQVTDAQGKSATGVVTVHSQGVGLAVNPQNAKLFDLVVVGGEGDDDVQIYAGRKKGDVKVTIDGESVGNFRPTGRIIAFGGDGDDKIQVKYLKLGAVLYGQGGDDRLDGSRASDVLIGGDGDDRLTGWEKRDILIGGEGLDEALEKKTDDLLLGDSTAYDEDSASNRLALFELSSAWNGKGTAAARFAKLAEGVGAMSANFGDDNVESDGETDNLFPATKKNFVLDLDAEEAE